LLYEEGRHFEAVGEGLHLIIGGTGSETMGSFQGEGQDGYVAGSVKKNLRVAKNPVYGEFDISLVLKRTVPGRPVLLNIVPGGTGNAFDGLHSDVTLFADSQEFVEVFRVERVLHHDMVVGEQDGIKIELGEGAQVKLRDGDAMTSDANEADKPFVTRLDYSFDHAAGAEGSRPIGFFVQGVELDEVDLVHMQEVEGAADLIVGGLTGALIRFGGEEERFAVTSNPIAQELFGFCIAGGGVDMVDAILEEEFHGGVDIFLGCFPKCGGAKNSAGAFVCGAAKG